MNSKSRFNFGDNWYKYLRLVNEKHIRQAELSLCNMLEIKGLEDKSFLDIGCGSGMFSLAAKNLAAVVHSFDYDAKSVECVQELKEKFYPQDTSWIIEKGDILDQKYVSVLNEYDYVYSWGVLHHTGDMWTALDNVAHLVKPGGFLFISIYNDQGRASLLWKKIKKAYNNYSVIVKKIILLLCFVRLWGSTTIKDILKGKPFRTWREYRENRGMSAWYDVVDWVGGYPFEVAKPEEIFDFFRNKGFNLVKLKTCAGGIGCNEFVFNRI